MILLVAVEKCLAGIISGEDDFGLRSTAEQYDVFQDSRCLLAVQRSQFKRVPVQMHRMNIGALVIEDQAVALTLL